MKQLPLIKKLPIEAIDLVRYSGASGDFNEIHTVPSKALSKGFPNIIAHGMLLMGWCTGAINEWFPTRKLHQFKVRFQSVVTPGMELTMRGRWEERNNGHDYGEIELIDLNGEIKLAGSFVLKQAFAK